MSSDEVVKSVAKKLKYYFEVKRLEDGFDLSDTYQPQMDHPPQKVRSALRYGGLHDRALKHYFSQPEVRVQLTQLNVRNARGTLEGKREKQVQKMLENYMKQYNFQSSSLQSCYYMHTSKDFAAKPEGTSVLRQNKKQKNLIGGWPILRTVPDQYITKGEASRLINSATKIICASELISSLDKVQVHKKGKQQQSRPRSFHENSSQNTVVSTDSSLKSYPRHHQKKSRQVTASFSHDLHSKRASPTKAKIHEYSSAESHHGHTPSRPSSSASSQSSSNSSTTASVSRREAPPPVSRLQSANYCSRTIIQNNQEEISVIQSTQTAVGSDVHQTKSQQKTKTSDKLEEEVTDGALCEYHVYVCTGSCLGASTSAPVKLILYGEKGRTKEFELNKLSKRYKIPFQKGKEDMFILTAHDIGRMSKVQIGHDRPELSYAWFLDNVTVFDMHAKRIFQFPCNRWLSGQDGDRKTYRILPVDREKDFIEAVDESMTKTPRSPTEAADCEPENASVLKENSRQKDKASDNYSTCARPGNIPGDSDSDNSSSSQSSGITKRRGEFKQKTNAPSKVPSSHKHQNVNLQKKPMVKEHKQRATKISLHRMPGSKLVEEIIIDTAGSGQADLAKEYADEDKKSEQDHKKQIEKERMMTQALLQGKNIHEAVRDGDIHRVKDLLHQFPEMKDFRDERSWTPLHLAAAYGNIELLKWLITSDADINAETSNGYNAMHMAAMNGHVNSMMLLQAMGSSIMGLTVEKQSALHLAAKSGHLECVKWLVANRASLVTENKARCTPLKLAEENHHDACADFLRVCLRDLSNPKSTFAQIHRQISGNGLLLIEENAHSGSGETPRRSSVKVKRHTIADSQESK